MAHCDTLSIEPSQAGDVTNQFVEVVKSENSISVVFAAIYFACENSSLVLKASCFFVKVDGCRVQAFGILKLQFYQGM